MELFSVTCTTCQQRLKVRDESAIGEIQICSKCGSMVLVEAPPGWQGAADVEPPPAQAAPPESPPSVESQSDSAHPDLPTDDEPSPPPRTEQVEAVTQTDDIETASPPPSTVADSNADGAPLDETRGDVDEVVESVMPDEPPVVPEESSISDVEPPAGTHEPVLPTDEWTSTSAQNRQQWLMLGGAVVGGMVLAVGLFGFWVSRMSDNQPREATEQPDPASEESELPVDSPAKETPEEEKTEVAAASDETDAAVESTDEVPKPTVAKPTVAKPTVAKPTVAKPVVPTTDPEPTEPRETTKPQTEPDETAKPATEPDGLTASAAEKAKTNEMILVPKDAEAKTESEDAAALSETLNALAPLIDGKPYATPKQAAETNEKKAPELDSGDLALNATSAPRPEPRVINVPVRLEDKIPEIEFPKVPLIDFVRFVTNFSTIPITLDPQALALVKVTPRTPVNVRLSDTNVGAVLSEALTPLRLDYVSTGSQLLITRAVPSDGQLREHSHSVVDLVGDDPVQLAALADMIVEMVEPDSWDESGGAGTVRGEKSLLKFRQRDTVLFQAIVFCERLRAARGLPPQSKFDPALFNLQPRLSQAEKRLASPATITYIQPTPFVRILDRLSAETELNILVDWQAIAELGWSPDGEATVSANNEPVADVLTKILRPMDLAYRVIDATTTQVTSPAQLAARLDIEFYPVADLLAEGQNGDEFVGRVSAELGDVGAVLHFDAPSKHLIAALPQPGQRKLADLLNQWRTKTNDKSD